ncbi:replicative DNA helicase [Orientia tsutsugamushi str. Gilliam]|uniref:Replicative DNA helicase n=1 Tax=Orientia tsutsugamushi str. Gilliam TaxID=1359184 RepID=A0A2U3QWL8_ORITS|nr:replicative DNA helicase [Orientia tsutsugamushi str. Gilliam]
MLIYREEYYLSRSELHLDSMEYEEWFTKQNKCYNTAEIIVAKHCNGPVGTVNLHYDNRYLNLIILLKTLIKVNKR